MLEPAPLVRDVVTFKRSPAHHPEAARVTAILMGRMFGTIEVTADDGTRHTLEPGEFTRTTEQ